MDRFDVAGRAVHVPVSADVDGGERDGAVPAGRRHGRQRRLRDGPAAARRRQLVGVDGPVGGVVPVDGRHAPAAPDHFGPVQSRRPTDPGQLLGRQCLPLRRQGGVRHLHRTSVFPVLPYPISVTCFLSRQYQG